MTEKRLLLVDDDAVFVKVLSRALTARGFSVATALDAAGALSTLRAQPMEFAVVDLRIGRENGLTLIPECSRAAALAHLLLTGYASIATAVERSGAARTTILRNLSTPTQSRAHCSTSIRAKNAKKILRTKTCRRCDAWNGSTSSACWPNATAMCPRHRAGSDCIVARCNAS